MTMIEDRIEHLISLVEQLVYLVDHIERRLTGVPDAPLRTEYPNTQGVPAPTPNGKRKSTLNDLTFADPQSQERVRAASVQFQIDHMTVPWSEAAMRKVLEYEEMVRAEYGDDAVLQLPWNRLARGAD